MKKKRSSKAQPDEAELRKRLRKEKVSARGATELIRWRARQLDKGEPVVRVASYEPNQPVSLIPTDCAVGNPNPFRDLAGRNVTAYILSLLPHFLDVFNFRQVSRFSHIVATAELGHRAVCKYGNKATPQALLLEHDLHVRIEGMMADSREPHRIWHTLWKHLELGRWARAVGVPKDLPKSLVKSALERHGSAENARQCLVAATAGRVEEEFISRFRRRRLRNFNVHMTAIGMPQLVFGSYDSDVYLLPAAADDLVSHVLAHKFDAIKKVARSYIRLQTNGIEFGELLDTHATDVRLIQVMLNASALEKYRVVEKLRAMGRIRLATALAEHAGEIARSGHFFGLDMPSDDVVASLVRLFLSPAWVHVLGAPRDYSDSYSCVWTRDVASGQFVPQVVRGAALRGYSEWKDFDRFDLRTLDGKFGGQPYVILDRAEGHFEIHHVLLDP
jgi:hypothetical protein